MSKHAGAVNALPSDGTSALAALGAALGEERKRRKRSLRAWATHLQISVPTLMRLEKGDPAVGMGAYVAALVAIDRHKALASLADDAWAQHERRRDAAAPAGPDAAARGFKTAGEMSAHQADRELEQALRVQSLSGRAYSRWLQSSWGRLQTQGNELFANAPPPPRREVFHFKTMAEKNRFDADLETARAMQICTATVLTRQ